MCHIVHILLLCITCTAFDHSVPLLSTTIMNTDPTASTSVTSLSVIVTSSTMNSIISNRPIESTCASTQLVAATVTVTITSTVHVTPSQSVTPTTSPSSTVTIGNTVSSSPSSLQCSNQQAAKDNDNSCNAVAICIPVALVIGLIVCVVTIVIVWRLRYRAIYNFATSNPQMAKIYNDLYGSVALYLLNVCILR